jgi:hypothetical protein
VTRGKIDTRRILGRGGGSISPSPFGVLVTIELYISTWLVLESIHVRDGQYAMGRIVLCDKSIVYACIPQGSISSYLPSPYYIHVSFSNVSYPSTVFMCFGPLYTIPTAQPTRTQDKS